jgi:hypothetical protein
MAMFQHYYSEVHGIGITTPITVSLPTSSATQNQPGLSPTSISEATLHKTAPAPALAFDPETFDDLLENFSSASSSD